MSLEEPGWLLTAEIRSEAVWALAGGGVAARTVPDRLIVSAAPDARADERAAQERIKALLGQGFQKPGDSENRLGFYVGQLGLNGER
jgi:hypothetical protein